jgi:hypothetical protein
MHDFKPIHPVIYMQIPVALGPSHNHCQISGNIALRNFEVASSRRCYNIELNLRQAFEHIVLPEVDRPVRIPRERDQVSFGKFWAKHSSQKLFSFATDLTLVLRNHSLPLARM